LRCQRLVERSIPGMENAFPEELIRAAAALEVRDDRSPIP
jgi:hypothetical protein